MPFAVPLSAYVMKNFIRHAVRLAMRWIACPILAAAHAQFGFRVYFLVTARIAHLA
jgi:hypothetical protein